MLNILTSCDFSWWQALLLGLLQGFTEFLPVSSSGHLEIGKEILGIQTTDNLLFTVTVHGATVLSTLVVFWKDIKSLFCGTFIKPEKESYTFVLKLIISMIPVAIVGLFFKDEVENLFGNGLLLVGAMLLLTATLLALSYFLGKGKRSIGYLDSFIIGVSQAVAVLPGLSRSGTTIATGLLIGNKKEELARFSFLMVIVPILGENILSLLSGSFVSSSIPLYILLIGFLSAFVSGLIACKLMIRIVSKGKLIYFAIYCAIVGIAVLLW